MRYVLRYDQARGVEQMDRLYVYEVTTFMLFISLLILITFKYELIIK